VYERVELAGRPGLVIERLEGEDLLTLLGRRPWRVASVARTLGGVHASLHATTAPDSLPELRAELRERLRSDLVPQDVREAVLPLLDGMPDGDRLCHGDLHPGNLLPRGDGSHVAIDWSMAARGDPAADVARTRLLILGAALPAETPAPVARLMELGRRLLWRGYLREYERRRGAPLDEAAVATWERIWAAARLAENIAEERKALLGLARAGPPTQP
jgi:Ser/Thr protein kinase RdoA (MazF antagonist)